MGCGCTRFTYRYACCHKKREYHTCWRRDFMKDNPCIAACLPRCHYERVSSKISRVCDKCMGYFQVQFGEYAASAVSREFIEYKKFNGLRKHLVLPESVPHENYLTEIFLQMAGATTAKGKEPFRNPPMSMTPEPGNPEEWWARKRARQARAEGREVPQQPPPLPRQPSPVEQRNRRERRRSRPEIPRKPVPKPIQPIAKPPKIKSRAPDHKNRGTHKTRETREPETARLGDYSQKKHGTPLVTVPAMIYPVPQHLQGYQATILNNIHEQHEYVDYHIPRGIPPTRSPQQPKPVSAKVARANARVGSDCSLVKRFNQMAEEAEIEGETIDIGYQDVEYNGSSSSSSNVPALTTPPKVPHWRYDTPYPGPERQMPDIIEVMEDKSASKNKGKGKDKGKGKEVAVPASPSPILASRSVATPLRSAPLYYVLDSPMSNGAKTGTKPPPRGADGVSPKFRERGVPTAEFLEENFEVQRKDRQSAHDPMSSSLSSPVLVSMTTPPATYSCAPQTCFCDPGDADEDVCPACLERRRLEAELQMEWI